MELSLIEKTGQTRIKISIAEWKRDSFLRAKFKGMQPTKQNSRFIYFVVNGDLLNKK